MITPNSSKNIALRNAIKSDAADLAILENVASKGLAMWFWQGAVNAGKGEDPLQWGKERMGNARLPNGYQNAVVATEGTEILGAANGYIAEHDEESSVKSANKILKPIYTLFDQCIGDWYLDSIAVYSTARGKGIGAMLLENCFKRAKQSGVKKFSLIAEDGNSTALAFYTSRGFVEINRLQYIAFNDQPASRNWLLLSKNVN